MRWNQTAGVVTLELTSAVAQEITLRLAASDSIDLFKVVEGSAKIIASPRGANARQVSLPAKEKVRLELRYKPQPYVPQVFKIQFVKPNTLPLRLGADSNGQNTLVGDMARASIFDRVLSAAEIASLANSDARAPAATMEGCVASWDFDLKDGSAFLSAGGKKTFAAKPVGAVTTIDTETALGKAIHLEGGAYLNIDHDATLNCLDGLTLETWIRPGQLSGSGARIIDKTPAGAATGYLLDTYPANSLRLIFRAAQVLHGAGLVANEWVHLAATIDGKTGEAALYIGGKQVKRQK